MPFAFFDAQLQSRPGNDPKGSRMLAVANDPMEPQFHDPAASELTQAGSERNRMKLNG